MDRIASPQQLQRLQEIARELGAVLTDDIIPLSPPRQRPTFRVPDDDRKADAVLGQLRIEISQQQPRPKGLRRAFSTTKLSGTHSYEEIYVALTRVIENDDLIGVAEVLLTRFKQLGGDINVARRASTGLIKKIRNADSPEERGHLLETATEISRVDAVQLLAPDADQSSLNESLRIALPKKDLAIIGVLLQYGANSSVHQQIFQNAASNGDIDLLELMLRAPQRVPEHCITRSLLHATANGSLLAVQLLMKAGARGDHDGGAALISAVEMDRIDLVAAIIVGPNPPSPTSLDRGLKAALSIRSNNFIERYPMTELLLCAGPFGDAKNEGLMKATILSNLEMMQLFLWYRADINYNAGCAVASAMQRNRADLVGILLQEQDLKAEVASELVGSISRTGPSAERLSSLSKLLIYGASGVRCNELLIAAAAQNDIETAKLLITYGKEHGSPPIVSVDYNAARSLQIAVSQGNVEMVKILALEGKPSEFSLSKAFSSMPKLKGNDQYLMVQTLLRAGAKGPEVDIALRDAVTSPERSKRLVEVLIQYGANVEDETLLSSISQGNADTAQVLLAANVPIETCAAALEVAMKLPIGQPRFRIVKYLLARLADTREERPEVVKAVAFLIHNCPGDTKLLRLLCQDGKASINFEQGLVIVLATQRGSPLMLDTLLQSEGGPPSTPTISRALKCAIDLPITDQYRPYKVEALLRGVKPQQALDEALVQEIKASSAMKRENTVIATLLSAGADVNAHEAASIRYAVHQPSILDLIMSRQPSPKSLSMAFPMAISMPEPDRLAVCEKLIQAGAIGEEINKALSTAVEEGPSALPLIRLILPRADIGYDGGSAIRVVVQQGFIECLDLLVPRAISLSTETKTAVFHEAIKLKDKEDRYMTVEKLLSADIPATTLAECLVIAVNFEDAAVTKLLLKAGASLDYAGGQAILSAASSGQRGLLRLLVDPSLGSKPSLSSLTSGFAGALSLKDRDTVAYYDAVEILLEAGMKGDAVDAALVESVREGDINLEKTQMIYYRGASANWHDGEALFTATAAGSLQTLSVLFQKDVSQSALKRSYQSAVKLPRDQRYRCIEMILTAGKTIDKHVTNTLIQATRDSPSDLELIKLLLAHDVFDDGESMAHAVETLDLDALMILIESPLAAQSIGMAFKAVTETERFWASAKNMEFLELMLVKGACGEPVAEVLVNLVDKYEEETDTSIIQVIDLLLRFGADVNYRRGLALQRASQKVDYEIIQKLLPNSNSDSKAMAIPYLFKATSDKAIILQIIQAFSDSAANDEQTLDIGFRHPDPALEPVLFMALSSFPRRTQILRALLDVGYSPNQWALYEVDPEVGREPWPVLCWALSQPEKKISSANIELLIEEGANVDFTSKSGTNPVTLSIQNHRPDILSALIEKGSKVKTSDGNGVTPLALASQLGNTKAMEHLMVAGAEIDDGSLHDAAADLRTEAMRVLVKYGHDFDYPSERHDGRSALAELCLNAVDKGTRSQLEEAVQFLIASGSDFRIRGVAGKHSGKTIFHYAMDSSDPLSMLQVLLKLPLWKVINDDCFLFKDETYTYSLTKYVEKGLFQGPQSQKEEITRLLRSKRGLDKFWANSLDAVQPEDYCGAPAYIDEEVVRQKARRKRLLEQREDAMAAVALKRDTVVEEGKIMIIQTNQEIKRDMEKSRAEVHLLEVKADTELRLHTRAENERQRLARNIQTNELSHLKERGTIEAANQRAIRHAEIEEDATRNLMQLEYMEKRITKEHEGVRARMAIEGLAREDQERAQHRMHDRDLARMKMQKSILDRSTTLAGQLQHAGMNQRQIGYVVGEV